MVAERGVTEDASCRLVRVLLACPSPMPYRARRIVAFALSCVIAPGAFSLHIGCRCLVFPVCCLAEAWG
eukprot:4622320-Pyramimonas_sp.AAC.1